MAQPRDHGHHAGGPHALGVPMLVNCSAYQDGKKLGEIGTDDISHYVSRPECFVWVAIKDPDPTQLAEMQQEFGLHELAVEDASKGHQRPKIEEYGDSLFAVPHTLEEIGRASCREREELSGRSVV